MRRAIIRYPKDSARRAVRLLPHYQIHELSVGFYSGLLLADTKEPGSVDIPSGKICQGAFSLVFKLDTPWSIRLRACVDELSVSGLNTGLFVGTDDVVIRSQRNTLENSKIEVQDGGGSLREPRISWIEPTPMHPRPYCVVTEITPHSGDADCHHDASGYCFTGDVGGTQPGKGKPQPAGDLTGESLDLHSALRGKKSAVFRSLVGPQDHPGGGDGTVSSIW